jgi:outer membrane receptor protein involved in Fe transport
MGTLSMRALPTLGSLLLLAVAASATIFAPVQGIVHDPQHRPIQAAQVTIKSDTSDWSKTMNTDDNGEFRFTAVPIGQYTVTLSAQGFATDEQKIVVQSGAVPVLHFALSIAKAEHTVEVSAEPDQVNAESSTTQSLVSRESIAQTPGADRANSLAMITNFVPGAVVVHDQLHIRGGHQVSWMVDGVPVPNTNIASNVGPQFDPKDIDYLEVQRGGLSAEQGDRTYGGFNVVTRSGFERNREAELVSSYGSFNQTNDQINFGDHTERFGYYGSVSGNRTDLGLETPTTRVLHDQNGGLSGFTSLIFNKTANDQLRLVASGRGDHYQIPNDPDQHAAGLRDVENERDSFVNFSWVHTGARGSLLTVSPYYHYNRAEYLGACGTGDLACAPLSPRDDRRSQYLGGHVTYSAVVGKHNIHAGGDVFGEHEASLFGIRDTTTSNSISQHEALWGSVSAAWLEDSYKVTPNITLNGGVRVTHAQGLVSETVADPRIGAAIRLPGVRAVLHGFYGHYYQPPPLSTVSGPLLQFASAQGFAFLPLRGERDHQYEVGVTVPLAGWTADFVHFQTNARNFFDHDVLGNSNIFFPLTIDRARIRGWEASLNSPQAWHRVRGHLAYSNQQTQARGDISGGLSDFAPLENTGWFYLDHDQRNTVTGGIEARLPWRSYASLAMQYGSGFLDGNGPAHLPSHTTFDVALGKSFGERWSVQVSGLNLANRRYLLDNSNTFGGTHFNDPRQVVAQVRYRFKY